MDAPTIKPGMRFRFRWANPELRPHEITRVTRTTALVTTWASIGESIIETRMRLVDIFAMVASGDLELIDAIT